MKTKNRKLKKFIALVLVAVMLIGSQVGVAFAAQANLIAALADNKVVAYERPDIKVKMDDSFIAMCDENGKQVYPLTYKSTVYLPLRAASGIMREPIEWVSGANTIFIGRTLSNPSKSILPPEESEYAKPIAKLAGGEQIAAKAYLRGDILIMYDFEVLELTNADGSTVCPIICGGTTYLPLEAVSQLMDEDLAWDEKEKTITIGMSQQEEDLSNIPKSTLNIIALYQKQSELYNNATAMIVNIAKMSRDDLKLMTKETTADYAVAQQYNSEIKQVITTTKGLTLEEQNALAMVGVFAEYCEHYILVMKT